jgi:hypothetical protein
LYPVFFVGHFSKVPSKIFLYFKYDLHQILKHFILNKPQNTLVENIRIVIDMVIEWSDAENFNYIPHYSIMDPLMLEENLDPSTTEAEFEDHQLAPEDEWLINTTPEERKFFEDDVDMVENSILDLLLIKRSHLKYILSYDVKNLIESVEDYVFSFL